MKANELTIGQRYIWRRNSEVSYDVTYLGCDNSGEFTLYEFEYNGKFKKMRTLLSISKVENDIKPIKEQIKSSIDYKVLGLYHDTVLLLDWEYKVYYTTNNNDPIRCIAVERIEDGEICHLSYEDLGRVYYQSLNIY